MASVGEIKDRLKRAALRKVTSSPIVLAAWGGFENLRTTGRGLVRATQVSSAERKRAAKEAAGELKAFGAPIQSFGNLARDTGVVIEAGARATSPRVSFKDALRETNAAVPRFSFASDALNKLESRGAIPRGSAKPIQFSSDIAASIMTPGIGKVNALSKLPAAQRLAAYTALRSGQGAVGGFLSEAGRTGDLEQAKRAARSGALFGGVGNVLLSPRLTTQVMRQGADAMTAANRSSVLGSTGGNIGKIDPLEALKAEARKYKSAEEFVKAKTEPSDYGYSHRPAEGPRAFDLTEKVDGEQMIPSDMYSKWYGSRGTPEDIESINALKKIKGNPEAEVTIYRASPSTDFNYGDWVTLSKKYAKQHAESNGDKTFKVHELKVKAKDIRWAMDDINEFGYFPKSKYIDIYNQATGKGIQAAPEGLNVPESGGVFQKIRSGKPTFKVGDRVSPTDRNNVGRVVAVNEDGTYRVAFTNRQNKTTATKTFSEDQLRGGKKTATEVVSSKKIRGFIETAKESELSPGIKDIIDERYTPKENATLISRATEKIAKQGLERTRLELQEIADSQTRGMSDQSVANSIVVIRMLNNSNRYEEAADLIQKLSKRLTDAGRTVQAARLLNAITPEGIQAIAQKELAKVGKNLTAEQAKTLSNLAEEIRGLPDGRERNLKVQKLFETAQDMVPSSFIDRVVTVWKAGLLTGFKTTGTNILANVGNTSLEKAKDPLAAGIDTVVSLFTGRRTKSLTVGGMGKGAVEGAKEAADYLTTGYDPRKIGSKVSDGNRVNYGNSKIGKATQAYVETVFRFIGAQDRPFYQSRFQNSLYDQAGAEAINRNLTGKSAKEFIAEFVARPPEQASLQAAIDAEVAVFQNQTKLGEAAAGLQRVGGGAGNIIIPFGKTPSAVATQIVNYSPVGIAKTIIENIGKGKFNQRAFSEGLARGLTGTAILAIGYKLAEKGMVNTSYPRTETERALWEAENRKANTIITNDGNQITAQALGPAGNAVLLGAYVYQATKNAENPAMAGLAGLGNTLTESTFLSGLSSSIDALKDPLREGSRFLRNTAGSTIPTLVSDVSRTTDLNEQGKPITREVNTVGEAIINRTPLRRNLIESKDILGRGRVSGESALGTMFNPLRTATLNQDEQTKELRRLRTATGDDLTLSRIDKTQTIGGQKVKLTPAQQDALESDVSPQINEAISSLIANPLYSKLSDEEKVKAVESLITDIRAAGKFEFAVENNLVTDEAILKAKKSLSAEAKRAIVTEKFNVQKYLSSAKKKSGRKGRTRVKVSRPSKGTVKTFKAARTKKFKSAKTIKSLL